MSAAPTDRLESVLADRYRIERELGAGGMATVYLAEDLKHDRKVALKVLKPELAAVVGAERFLAEIRTTANLQHPHILPLFDSGEADGFLYYVMPYIEGETLRERLDRERQLPVDEALRIATAVANALQSAHEQGVVHRDIKPANILLSRGEPLVADFGIALAVSVGGGGRLTETGLSLGTPHYMSPEQATGDPTIGAASDIYALGCVLYEMLVGDPPYSGSSAQAILGKILTGDAEPVTRHRRSVPDNVDGAIRKALERLPADRFATAAELARALADPGFRHGPGAVVPGRGRSGVGWPWATAAAVAALTVGAVGGPMLQRSEEPPAVVHLVVPFRPGQEPRGLDMGLSPDGTRLFYVAAGADPEDGQSRQLWIRRLAELDASPVAGTEGAVGVMVSHDGSRVAFAQPAAVGGASGGLGGHVAVLDVESGTVTRIAEGTFPIAWGDDGSLFFHGPDGDLRRTPATGGDAEVVPGPSRAERAFQISDVLPGSDFALVHLTPTDGDPSVAVLDLGTGQMTVLFPGIWAQFVDSGHLVFASADFALMASTFDQRTLAAGTPVQLIERADWAPLAGDGTLLYSTETPELQESRLWLVEPGGRRDVLADVQGRTYVPRFSPDGGRVAYAQAMAGGEIDLWTIDVSRGARTRVTFGGRNLWYPTWTPDGSRLAHADGNYAQNRLLSSSADGIGVADTLRPLGPRSFPSSWSPDGRTLAYYVGPDGTPTGSRDIWMLQVAQGDPREDAFIETPFEELGAVFSPDGAWVAYLSDKSGRTDVYARPYPGPGPEVTISVGGGSEPVWGPTGDRLYYRREGELVVADVEGAAGTLAVSPPRRVMDDPYRRDDTFGGSSGMANYDIAPGGDRFVFIEDTTPDRLGGSTLYIALNWAAELAARVPR